MGSDDMSLSKDFVRELIVDFKKLVHDLGQVIESNNQDYRQVIEDIDTITRELEKITIKVFYWILGNAS